MAADSKAAGSDDSVPMLPEDMVAEAESDELSLADRVRMPTFADRVRDEQPEEDERPECGWLAGKVPAAACSSPVPAACREQELDAHELRTQESLEPGASSGGSPDAAPKRRWGAGPGGPFLAAGAAAGEPAAARSPDAGPTSAEAGFTLGAPPPEPRVCGVAAIKPPPRRAPPSPEGQLVLGPGCLSRNKGGLRDYGQGGCGLPLLNPLGWPDALLSPFAGLAGQLLEPRAERELLQKRLDDNGLEQQTAFSYGNCQFTAVSDQLFGSPQYHTHVRAAMATQLRASPERYRPYVPDQDFDEYVEAVAANREWGDQVTLQAIADSYGVQVNLLTPFSETAVPIVPAKPEPDQVLWLSWSNQHYCSLRPKETAPAMENEGLCAIM